MSIDCGWFVLPVHEGCANGLDDGLVGGALHVDVANMTMLIDLHGAGDTSVPSWNGRLDGVNSNGLSKALIFSVSRENRVHPCEFENRFVDLCCWFQRINPYFDLARAAADDC